MKAATRQAFVLLCAAMVFVRPASARHLPKWVDPANIPAADPGPLPAEAPPAIDPDAAPSESLGPFLKTHLDKILAPLGTRAFAQADLLAGMKADYAKILAGAPDSHKPAIQLAMAMCDSLAAAIEERRKAADAMNNSYNVRRSEAYQPRGGAEATKNSNRDEAFFYQSQKNNWLQNATALRTQIAAVYQRERAAEIRAGAWTPPPPPPAPKEAVAAAPTPSVSVPAPEVDPVVGEWTWQNNGPLKLEADHAISGSRAGTWKYTCTTNAGRNYEMHWAHKNWVDYVVLSADGKMLDGKSKQGKHVYANR